MNHPAEDVVREISWMAAMGLEFIDLTLEPPTAASWRVDVPAIRRALSETGLKAVGHTAFYLPLASPFEGVRSAAVAELKRCLDIFAQVGVRWMNVHPDRYAPMHDRRFFIEGNIRTLNELIEHGRGCGVGIMIENLPGDFNSSQQLGELLSAVSELGLHLDIGHANLLVPQNTTGEILRDWGSRLRHVHLHDNKGGSADLHLPLGTGTIDLKRHLGTLIEYGFDGTITLEVFAPDRHYLSYSRDVLRRTWNELKSAKESAELVGAGKSQS